MTGKRQSDRQKERDVRRGRMEGGEGRTHLRRATDDELHGRGIRAAGERRLAGHHFEREHAHGPDVHLADAQRAVHQPYKKRYSSILKDMCMCERNKARGRGVPVCRKLSACPDAQTPHFTVCVSAMSTLYST